MTIGDFSRAVRLTAKALRFYHQNGILEPAVVDDQNGYRLYAAEQIADAQIVRTLRELHVPVQSIREVLAAPDVSLRGEVLAQHLHQMEQQLTETRLAVQSLRDMLEPAHPDIDISYRSVPETRAIAISDVIELRDLGSWFRRSTTALRDIAARMDPTSAVTYGGMWPNELFADERGLATVFLTSDTGIDARAIDASAIDGSATVVDLPPVELAVATHEGSDETLPRVYAALGRHVAQHELATDAPVRETYLRGLPGIDEHSVSEIGWPIFRVSH